VSRFRPRTSNVLVKSSVAKPRAATVKRAEGSDGTRAAKTVMAAEGKRLSLSNRRELTVFGILRMGFR
jgi:hypothetical protein